MFRDVQVNVDRDPCVVASRVVEQQGLDAEGIAPAHADRRRLVDQIGHSRRRRGGSAAMVKVVVLVVVVPVAMS